MSDSRQSFDVGGIEDASTRRRFLAFGGTTAAAALAGCGGLFPGSTTTAECRTDDGGVDIGAFRGSGPLVDERAAPEGTSMEELPDLSGELTVYVGGGEGGIWRDLFALLECLYDGFTIEEQTGSASGQVNTILEEQESGSVVADAFLSVDAGSLGAVADAGAAASLPEEVTSMVPSEYRDADGEWIGFAGRARTVPYNTEQLSESDVPDTVMDFPDVAAFENALGWAPSYGAFQSFVTAMRQLEGDDATRTWLEDVQAHGADSYGGEDHVANAVADGEIVAGFANHYYALRIKNQRSDAPIDLAFTSGDAGALVNVSGAQLLADTENEGLVADFFRHLASAEAQEFFATHNYAYPVVPGVSPVGDLPTVDELNPPDVDLAALSDVSATIDLMQDAGVL